VAVGFDPQHIKQYVDAAVPSRTLTANTVSNVNEDTVEGKPLDVDAALLVVVEPGTNDMALAPVVVTEGVVLFMFTLLRIPKPEMSYKVNPDPG